MESLLQLVSANATSILLMLAVWALLASVFASVLAVRLRRIETRWKQLLTADQGQSLESILYEHLRERIRFEERHKSLVSRVDTLESKMRTAKRFSGLVRYDAFEDIGGNQSFAYALYDEDGNGTVLNGLVGRNDCRVYCKPLLAGRSERNLSQEEERAIREARTGSSQSIVSP